MNAIPENEHYYNLSEDYPFYHKLTQNRWLNTQAKLAALGLCIAWVPLVILSALDGKLYSGVEMPFIKDITIQTRLLIALPLLILIKENIDEKLSIVIRYICNTLLFPEDRDHFIATHLHTAKRQNNSVLTNIIIFLIIISMTTLLVMSGTYAALESGITSWMTNLSEGDNSLSLAGYWCIFISIPLFQFFGLRWMWQYIVWVFLLYKFSTAKLKLLPTHADNSAGLGIVLLAQQAFNLLFVAIAIIISGELMTNLLEDPGSFDVIKKELVFFIAASLFIVTAPLFFFVKNLTQVKTEGLIKLSEVSATLSSKFEGEWINTTPLEDKLDEDGVEPSIICDYNALYASLQELKIFPMSLKDLIPMSVMLFAPFVPILFIHYSVAELVQKISGMLL